MILQNSELAWKTTFHYLGIDFKAGRTLEVDNNQPIRKFYSSCNSILNKTTNTDDITRLYLIETHCLPILTYAYPSLHLNQKQLNERNTAWNNVYRKIFGFNLWESVKVFIAGLGKLDLKHILLKLTLNFYIKNLYLPNPTFKYILFRVLLTELDSLCTKMNVPLIHRDIMHGAVSEGQLHRLVRCTFENAAGLHV